jgi:glyoxylase-like metal-dependent hydrolase (beta-lactamase superfamily II)
MLPPAKLNKRNMKNVFVFTFIFNFSVSVYSQNINYEVYALRFASVEHSFALSSFVLGAADKDSMHGVFMFWLIKGSNGKNILVDAGFINDVDEANNFDLKKYIRPDSMLTRVGLQAEDITDVILTHPHWDHADGIGLFPNAQVWIQKEDYGYFVGAAWQKEDDHRGFNKRDVRKLLELNLAGKLNLVEGDEKEIIPGIIVYTGSRHTFNSQYVLVKSGSDKIILASDNVYSYYNLEHLKSAPNYATFDTNAYVRSMERMKTLASNIKFIIPGHDALLFSRFPMVAEGVIKIK